MNLLDSLRWRYATKKMNGLAIPQDQVDKIIEAAYLAPTSSGLQPFRIIEVTNSDLKEKIKAIAFDQSQITDSSHLLIFAAWDNYTTERINGVFRHTALERGMPEDTLADYKNKLITSYTPRDARDNFEHTARQAYIGLGTAIAAAAELRIDATPMEGFEAADLDTLLGLPEKGLKSVTILALGYRDEANDWLVGMKKVRTPKDEFLIRLN